MATFNETMRPTSWGFYDADPLFQFDADRMITFVLRTLGDDVLNVELTKKEIWSQFERATRKFESYLIEYQATSNLASLLGMPTGSFDPNNLLHPTNINLTNVYVRNNLEFLDRLAEAYTEYIGLGGTSPSYSGSIELVPGKQDYDLYSDLKLEDGTVLSTLAPSGSEGKMQIYEVFQVMPLQYVYNGAIVSNFVGVGAAAGSTVTDARFHVLPVYEDVLRGAMLKTAQRVRRSQYSYKITGKNIRIFPIPSEVISGVTKLWIRVGFKQSPLPGFENTLAISGTISGYPSGSSFIDGSIFGASNPANVPFGFVTYKTLNPWARNWIAEYTLACCMELLGWTRTKFESIPLPNQEVRLNGEKLLTSGRENKEKLETALKEKLEALSYDKLQEMEANRAEQMVKWLSFVPIPPHAMIKMG